MFTEEEIAEKLKSVISAYKAVKTNFKHVHEKDKKYPDYNPIYSDTIEIAEKVKIHAVHGVIPEELLSKRSPNQTPEEAKYIKDNYKQTTLPVFTDYMSTISRMWNDGNWDIKFNQQKDIYKGNSLQDYVTKGIHIHGSLEAFFKDILTNKKAIDGNAVFVTKPRKYEVEENELVEPMPFIYDCENVILFSEGEYALFLTNEKTIVDFGNTKKKEGLVFEFYDDSNIWKISQVGKQVDYKFDFELVFEHNAEELPCQKLKGIPRVKNDEIIYESPFLAACDTLDDAILDSTYLRASKAKCVFPYQYMIGDKCEFDNGKGICNGGYVPGEDGAMITCKECKGTGLKSRISPLGTLLMRPADKFGENDKGISGPPMGYVAPPTETLEFLKKSISDNILSARSILQLNTSSNISSNPNDITATGKVIDMKAMYAFVQNISNQTFELFEFALEMIGKMRYKGDFVEPEVTYPKTFDFRTEEDYTNEIANAIKNKMPDIAIYQLIYAYINTRFSSQKETIDTFLLILQADRLALSAPDDIALMAAGNTVNKWEQVLHTSAMSFIADLSAENPEFFKKEMKDKVKMLQDKAKQVANELTVVAPVL